MAAGTGSFGARCSSRLASPKRTTGRQPAAGRLWGTRMRDGPGIGATTAHSRYTYTMRRGSAQDPWYLYLFLLLETHIHTHKDACAGREGRQRAAGGELTCAGRGRQARPDQSRPGRLLCCCCCFTCDGGLQSSITSYHDRPRPCRWRCRCRCRRVRRRRSRCFGMTMKPLSLVSSPSMQTRPGFASSYLALHARPVSGCLPPALCEHCLSTPHTSCARFLLLALLSSPPHRSSTLFRRPPPCPSRRTMMPAPSPCRWTMSPPSKPLPPSGAAVRARLRSAAAARPTSGARPREYAS